jgi:hypothetical protein
MRGREYEQTVGVFCRVCHQTFVTSLADDIAQCWRCGHVLDEAEMDDQLGDDFPEFRDETR